MVLKARPRAGVRSSGIEDPSGRPLEGTGEQTHPVIAVTRRNAQNAQFWTAKALAVRQPAYAPNGGSGVGDLADADDRVGGHFARSEPDRRLAAFVQGLLAVHPGCPGELP